MLFSLHLPDSRWDKIKKKIGRKLGISLGYTKVDRKRLKEILGKELHKYFFSSVDPRVGSTIRNANMHIGKSPNPKASQTIRLVNKMRVYIKDMYDLKDLTLIEEQHSPTRGLYRDDGGVLILKGSSLDTINLAEIDEAIEFARDLPIGVELIGKGSNDIFKHM